MARAVAPVSYTHLRGEGLDEVIVRAKLQTYDAILDLALCSKHDDRNIRGVADGTAHALTGKLGQHEVEHDQVELMLLELLDGGLPVADADNPVTFALKICGNRIADGLLIFNQQDLTCI